MVEIEIQDEDNPEVRGMVRYDPETKEVEVEFPDSEARARVEAYLQSPRTFFIPQSDEIDDYASVTARPTDDESFFDLAMCGLWSNTGVWVDWGRMPGEGE